MIRREDMCNKLILFRCKGPPLHDTPLELYSFGTAVGTPMFYWIVWCMAD